MQYILTQDELNKLKDKIRAAEKEGKDTIQKLCTLVAVHMPITRDWDKDAEPRPWGCMHAEEDTFDWYCDKCPVQDMCPEPHKGWSK